MLPNELKPFSETRSLVGAVPGATRGIMEQNDDEMDEIKAQLEEELV
jgi:hypothetical protein